MMNTASLEQNYTKYIKPCMAQNNKHEAFQLYVRDFPADSCLSIPQVGILKGNEAELSETKSVKSPVVHHVA